MKFEKGTVVYDKAERERLHLMAKENEDLQKVYDFIPGDYLESVETVQMGGLKEKMW